MQCRPLHMVLARGRLPEFCGHCVDGAATRLTVTSHREIDGRTVWQIGGQIAETGVAQDERSLVSRAKSEVEATIPGIELSGGRVVNLSSRSGRRCDSIGSRPETSQMIREKNILTVWPTKLCWHRCLPDELPTHSPHSPLRGTLMIANWKSGHGPRSPVFLGRQVVPGTGARSLTITSVGRPENLPDLIGRNLAS